VTRIIDLVSLEVEGLVEDGEEEMTMTHLHRTCHDRLGRRTPPAVVVRVGGQGSGLELLVERLLAMLQAEWQEVIRMTEHILEHMVEVEEVEGGSVEQMSTWQLVLQEPILVGDQIRVRRTLHHGMRVQVLGQRAGDELLFGLIGSISQPIVNENQFM